MLPLWCYSLKNKGNLLQTHAPISYRQSRLYLSILVPRGRASFGQLQELRPLLRSNFWSMRRVIVSLSQPIRFVRFDSEHAQSDRKSVNRRLPVLDLPRG